MGYQLEYGNHVLPEKSSNIHVGRTAMMTAAVAFLFCWAVQRYWSAGAAVLDHLTSFQGLHQIHQSLDLIVMELRSGTPLTQAVAAFCREVVQLGIAYAA